ncbi:unnamed protein product [Paramecium octaurelia]|uniref:Uncharacterized protein n=1 Tax=Paramecium octaurelia TaxID=43137 RepID=A0A8S1X9K1_PAROT|nr:unnamed protein product [Paramecium octaurelia]
MYFFIKYYDQKKEIQSVNMEELLQGLKQASHLPKKAILKSPIWLWNNISGQDFEQEKMRIDIQRECLNV